MNSSDAHIAFVDHEWDCHEDSPIMPGGPWWWKVFRDGAYAGLLRSRDCKGLLTADATYEVFTADGDEITVRPYTESSSYTNALIALNSVIEGGPRR